ncbi:MAG: TIGR00730 family Rossman fold protein [Bacteroidota bacterium]
MQSLCVFCGSRKGVLPQYEAVAYALGIYLAENNIRLIYGAGNIGLMGVVAEAALSKGGEVVGVIPNFLMDREVGHKGLSQLILTETMHERKQIMAEMSDGFLTLPGGFGTMDELCEILTWRQLGLHDRPIGLLNMEGYFDALITLFNQMVIRGFVGADNRHLLFESTELFPLLDQMHAAHSSRDSQFEKG